MNKIQIINMDEHIHVIEKSLMNLCSDLNVDCYQDIDQCISSIETSIHQIFTIIHDKHNEYKHQHHTNNSSNNNSLINKSNSRISMNANSNINSNYPINYIKMNKEVISKPIPIQKQQKQILKRNVIDLPVRKITPFMKWKVLVQDHELKEYVTNTFLLLEMKYIEKQLQPLKNCFIKWKKQLNIHINVNTGESNINQDQFEYKNHQYFNNKSNNMDLNANTTEYNMNRDPNPDPVYTKKCTLSTDTHSLFIQDLVTTNANATNRSHSRLKSRLKSSKSSVISNHAFGSSYQTTSTTINNTNDIHTNGHINTNNNNHHKELYRDKSSGISNSSGRYKNSMSNMSKSLNTSNTTTTSSSLGKKKEEVRVVHQTHQTHTLKTNNLIENSNIENYKVRMRDVHSKHVDNAEMDIQRHTHSKSKSKSIVSHKTSVPNTTNSSGISSNGIRRPPPPIPTASSAPHNTANTSANISYIDRSDLQTISCSKSESNPSYAYAYMTDQLNLNAEFHNNNSSSNNNNFNHYNRGNINIDHVDTDNNDVHRGSSSVGVVDEVKDIYPRHNEPNANISVPSDFLDMRGLGLGVGLSDPESTGPYEVYPDADEYDDLDEEQQQLELEEEEHPHFSDETGQIEPFPDISDENPDDIPDEIEHIPELFDPVTGQAIHASAASLLFHDGGDFPMADNSNSSNNNTGQDIYTDLDIQPKILTDYWISSNNNNNTAATTTDATTDATSHMAADADADTNVNNNGDSNVNNGYINININRLTKTPSPNIHTHTHTTATASSNNIHDMEYNHMTTPPTRNNDHNNNTTTPNSISNTSPMGLFASMPILNLGSSGIGSALKRKSIFEHNVKNNIQNEYDISTHHNTLLQEEVPIHQQTPLVLDDLQLDSELDMDFN